MGGVTRPEFDEQLELRRRALRDVRRAQRATPADDVIQQMAGLLVELVKPAPADFEALAEEEPDSALRLLAEANDHVAPATSTDREPIDVLVADGLNAQMRARDIAGVLAVMREIGGQITRIDESGVKFWEAEPRPGVPRLLSTIRLLLWTRVTKRWEAALAAGKNLEG